MSWLFLSISSLFAQEAPDTSTRVRTVVTTRELSHSEDLYNQAAVAMNEGQAQRCLELLKKVPSEELHSEAFLRLGYICAVAASHLSAADIIREELGLTYSPPNSLDIHHAWMLRREHKYQEALDALVPEGWQSQKHKELGTTMQAILFTDLGRWTEAWLLAGSPYVEQNAQLYIAQELRTHGHVSKSKSLYDRVCPTVSNAQQMGCASIIHIPQNP